MKEHDIHRLPVVEDGKLVGLLTEELVAGHSPSMATSLSMHELNYLLNKTTASEIMQKQVLTVKAHTLLEEAASLMRQQKSRRPASRRCAWTRGRDYYRQRYFRCLYRNFWIQHSRFSFIH